MRKTILTLACATGAFAATTCVAHSTPQTAAQANAAVAEQTPTNAAPPPVTGGPRDGHGGGMHRSGRQGGMMRADVNHDGIVTRAEATAAADQRFAALDADHDGRITAAEIQADRDRMRERRQARQAKIPAIAKADYLARMGARFDAMDTNHDGKLDATERTAMHGMHRGRRAGMNGEAPPPPAPGN